MMPGRCAKWQLRANTQLGSSTVKVMAASRGLFHFRRIAPLSVSEALCPEVSPNCRPILRCNFMQLDLFEENQTPPLANPKSPFGLEVITRQPCKSCGTRTATIEPGRGPHAASLRCAACGGFVSWMSRADLDSARPV
jgi:hypothetical protein